MQLIFDSAELMSLNHTLQYVGDYNYRNEQSLDIQGVILENNFSGILPVWDEMRSMISGAVDFSEIIVQGFSLGSGILQSLSFDSSTDVRQKRYNASILIHQTGNLFNVSGSYFSGLSDLQNQRLDLVNELSEEFSFTHDEDNVFTYNRNFSINLTSGIGVDTPSLAKSFAGIFFSGGAPIPFINSLYPSFYLQSGKKYYSETYDLIKGSYNFSEDFKFQDNDPFVWTFTHSAQFQEFSSQVTENGYFEGIDSNNYETARQAFISNIASAYTRCNDVYNVYIGTGCSLINTPVSQTINLNKFVGTVEYDITFSDRQDNLTGCAWERSTDYSKGNNGFYQITENGTIQGYGAKTFNPNEQYLSALNCFSGISSGVAARISGEFIGNTGFLSNCSSGVFLESESYTDSEYNGTIEYNFTYTNDPGYNTPSGIDYTGVTYTDTVPVALKSIHAIPNYKEVAAPVYRGNSSLGVFGNAITVAGSGDENSIQALINTAQDLVLVPSGSDTHLNAASYTFDPKNKTLTLNVDYNYVNYRALLNIIV